MFKSAIIILLTLPCIGLAGNNKTTALLDALAMVESGGRCDAVGDKGKAVGILQIWPVMVKDVNRISGRHYTLKDRLSKQKSYEICEIYFGKYCKGKSNEYKARCWNGGPQGYKNPKTLKYWYKVEKELEK